MIAPSPPDTAKRLGLDLNGIMWTDATVNPGLYGYQKISPACTNCYAEEMAARIVRMGGDEPNPAGPAVRYAQGLKDGRWTGRVAVDPSQIAPAFAKLPKRPGRIRRVFVTSMSDLFHDDVPFEFLDAVFAEMEARSWIVFQVLTKRAERMAAYAADRKRRTNPDNVPERHLLRTVWPPNVWAGVTAEDQRRLDERAPYLLQVPAVRFLSVEPQLGAIDARRYLPPMTGPWGVTPPATWDEVTWPDWVPAETRENVEKFWSASCGRGPADYARSAWFGSGMHDDPPAFGATASLRTIAADEPRVEGRYVHLWNNIGCIVDADGKRHTVSIDSSRERVLCDPVPGKRGEWRRASVSQVILGSESDGNRPGARETRDEWALDLVDQCDAAGTAVFAKQLTINGRLCSLPLVRGRVRAEFPEVSRV